MAEISKIKLPSGNTYELKDAVARELIAALQGSTAFLGLTTTEIADEDTTNPISINGSNVTVTTGNIVIYDKGEFIWDGTKWIEFGDLSTLGDLAYKDGAVIVVNGTSRAVYDVDTTWKGANSSVSFSGGTTDKVLGSDATFTTTVTPTVKYMDVLVSTIDVDADGTANAITGLGTPSTETFVKSVTAETSNKLVTTTVPNVTGNADVSIPNVTGNSSVVANKSTWSFTMGSGNDAETLIIGGANGDDVTATNTTLGTNLSASKVTLGTAKTVATGAVSTSGTGSAIVTNVTIGDSASAITALGTPTTSACLTGVQVTQQPTARLSVSDTQNTPLGGGSPTSKAFVSGITSASTTTNNKDEVTAVTNIGTGTAAGQTVTAQGTSSQLESHKIYVNDTADFDIQFTPLSIQDNPLDPGQLNPINP